MTAAQRDRAATRLYPLVRMLARRAGRLLPHADLDDLAGDGCIGLMRAIDTYDAKRGIPIERYAARVIIGAILNGARSMDPVSERVRRTIRGAERLCYALAAESGAMPTEAELEVRVPGLARARAVVHRVTPCSLDAPLPANERLRPDETADPATIFATKSEAQRLRGAVHALPSRARTVVIGHYYDERPLRQIGTQLAVSPQRASQLHVSALAKLRESLAVTV